ncbi:hypothetical protein H0H92_005500 [Tricholoma furcatifolium]|nr:hypothetical protein H0H92_005500 [Tricholoma furcatifolium]
MQLTSLFATVAFTLASVVSAAVLPRETLDVFTPTITSPTAETVWYMGTQVNVTWSTSNAPVNISNGAAVQLNGYGYIARGFDLRAGWVTVNVPLVSPVQQYQITLFGDSGDVSAPFTIAFDPSNFDPKVIANSMPLQADD